MNDQNGQKGHIPGKIILCGIGLGVVSWFVAGMVDAFVYSEGSFRQTIFAGSPAEFVKRSLIMLIVMGVSIYGGLVISRLKWSERRLIESEQRYRSLVETARDVIYTLSSDGSFTSLNASFERITGWRLGDAIGKNFLNFVHPEDVSRALTLFKAVLSGQMLDIFELRIRVRSGEYITGEITVTPQMQNGRVIGLLGIARDVTDREKTEQNLRENEAKYRDLFENANDLIQSVAVDGSFLYVNRAWRETLGYSEEEVARLSMLDIIHPDCQQHCREIFRRVTTGERIDRVETVFVAKSGRSVVVEGNINCSIENGTPIATRGIFRDITEHRRASEFIKNILESVDEGFTVVNRDYQIILANKAYSDQIKTPLHDIIGQHCYKICHRISKPCFESGEDCAIRQTLRSGEPYAAIHVHTDKEGNAITIETKSYPLRDSSGMVVSAIMIHNDVSEKKKLEAQLRHSQKMEAIGTLAGGIAHDFNNILTAIIGYGTLLHMKMGEENPLRPFVDQILSSTERAANLTQSLLAFSRKQVINLQPVALNSLVQRMERLISRLIGEDINIALALSNSPMSVRADAGQIEQVLLNLATNARDAMPQGGLLTIETGDISLDHEFIRIHGYGRVGRYALLSVSDTGAGMDERTRNRIFEPFFTTKEVGKGTGLGLAIVYGIVKQHGGYINVYSEPGTGTAFKIYLPLVPAMIEETRPIDIEVPEGGMATILVAEDDVDVRKLTQAVLEGFGYTVITAVDGEDALLKFSRHKDQIQLLLLDIIMPKKNGKMVFEKIREIRPDMKALFTSGYTSEFIHRKGILEDSCNFISKPLSPRDLLRKVKEILDAESNESYHPVV